jgi:hypothetical protein
MDKLQSAKNKFYKNKGEKPFLGNSFQEFILDCYLDHSPSSYGKYIQHKIIHDCKVYGKLDVDHISDRKNMGDCRLFYPSQKYFVGCEVEGKKYEISFRVGTKYFQELNFEVKCSFLGKTNCYTIRNIRPYQKIDGGYIICLVDCEKDFTPEFYVIDPKVLFSDFTITHMNGVASEHKGTSFENYGITVKKDSYSHVTLKENNLLSGTNIEDLYSYLHEKRSDLEGKFLNNVKDKKEFNRFISDGFKNSYNISVDPSHFVRVQSPYPLF